MFCKPTRRASQWYHDFYARLFPIRDMNTYSWASHKSPKMGLGTRKPATPRQANISGGPVAKVQP